MLHETMEKFCQRLLLAQRPATEQTYRKALSQFCGWLKTKAIDPLKASTDDLRAYQRWLSEEYRSPAGQPLERATLSIRLAAVKSYYRWLARRGLILMDVARKIVLSRVRRSVTTKDYLTLQEATALVQTQAAQAKKFREGSYRWAREVRTLALLSVAIATGRRRCSLMNLKVSHLDFDRNEIRIEREKGKSGRVIPVASWAMAVAKQYVEQARPVLDYHIGNPFLFVGEEGQQMNDGTFARQLERVHKLTADENPDLDELAAKHITPHSLRVSFATLLFSGGCNIRSINELMDHETLSTTAKYTPIPVEDLRRACRLAHPRA